MTLRRLVRTKMIMSAKSATRPTNVLLRHRRDKMHIIMPKIRSGRSSDFTKSQLANDGKSKKLLPKYSGPYVVIAFDYDRYVFEDLSGMKSSKYISRHYPS